MTPRMRITNVRPWNGGLRFTVAITGGDVVTVETTRGGSCVGLQSLHYIDTTGSAELDEQVLEHVRDSVAQRRTHQRLDQLDGRRWGRVQMPRERGWSA